MREGISYTVTLNFVITFVIIVFALLSATLVYFKSNKAGNIIVNGIERYEGFHAFSESYINNRLISLGQYNGEIDCPETVTAKSDEEVVCPLVIGEINNKISRSYCVYLCNEGDYYYYRIRTNMVINIPLARHILRLPIYANTNRMYDFRRIYQKILDEE